MRKKINEADYRRLQAAIGALMAGSAHDRSVTVVLQVEAHKRAIDVLRSVEKAQRIILEGGEEDAVDAAVLKLLGQLVGDGA